MNISAITGSCGWCEHAPSRIPGGLGIQRHPVGCSTRWGDIPNPVQYLPGPARQIRRDNSDTAIAHTSRPSVSDHLFPFALWTAFPSSLTGRYSCDYYGNSVAIGLAPRQAIPRSSLPYVSARRRRPTHLLECPRWESLRTPKVVPAILRHVGTGSAPVSGVFPAGVMLHLLEIRVLGNQALAILRGSRNASFHTPEHDHCFSGRLRSPPRFRVQVSHQTQEPPFEFLPAALGI